MFRFLSQKLLNKKWLNLCLLLGIVLLIASVACNPMFQDGASDMMLQRKFDTALLETNKYPCVAARIGVYDVGEYGATKSMLEDVEAYHQSWNEYLQLDVLEKQTRFTVPGDFSTTSYGSSNQVFDISFVPNMEKHIDIEYGAGLDEKTEMEGTYPCMLTRQQMDDKDLVVGEVITIKNVTNAADEPLQFTIVGVYKNKDAHDLFWYETPLESSKNLYVSQNSFDSIIKDFGFSSVTSYTYEMLDYGEINHRNADDVYYYTSEFQRIDPNCINGYQTILKEYKEDAKTITIMMWVLELPLFALLLAFIYMVSGQILEMENGEISMLKSRGSSTKQILSLYLGQSAILSVIGLFLGIPLGYLLCKLASCCTSFMKFSTTNTKYYGLDIKMLPYGAGAAVIAILFMTLPVIKYAKTSIVEKKTKKKKFSTKPFWERYFIDLLLAGVSVYLLFNYTKQKNDIATDILAGKLPDPLIFINSSLFIFASGLLILRLIGYLVRLIYKIGKKKWKPAVYASFLQITRTTKKQGFISVFLVMTIAMGLFNANLARTINENNKRRAAYDVGTEVVVKENWTMKLYYLSDKTPVWYYEEPDFAKFEAMKGKEADNITKVIKDTNTEVSANGNILSGCMLLGINTKEFGETAHLQDGLTDKHWYNYLNILAKMTNGVIISKNMAEKFDLSVGDSIDYSRFNPITTKHDEAIATVEGVVCGIVDAWPGYDKYIYFTDEDGKNQRKENYLVVANYSYLIGAFGQTPYEVWIDKSKSKDTKAVLSAIEKNEVTNYTYVSGDEELEKLQSSSIVLTTNGLFSLSFIITIILCTVGFLIYWITSIKQRELLFGIYRAMGMSMKEINKMLVNEQLFSSVLASLAGYGVGILATFLFVKLVSIVYLPEKHCVPIGIIIKPIDIVEISVVVVIMFAICFFVIKSILKKMNITQALKLGED